jgi:hypothetical protein
LTVAAAEAAEQQQGMSFNSIAANMCLRVYRKVQQLHWPCDDVGNGCLVIENAAPSTALVP